MKVVRRLPVEEQEAIAQVMLSIAGEDEAGDVDSDGLREVMEALAQVERGEIASDAELEAAFRAFRQ